MNDDKPDLISEKLSEVRESIRSTNESIAALEMKRGALIGLGIALERRTRRRTRAPLFERKKPGQRDRK